jgi:hypothetical protein
MNYAINRARQQDEIFYIISLWMYPRNYYRLHPSTSKLDIDNPHYNHSKFSKLLPNKTNFHKVNAGISNIMQQLKFLKVQLVLLLPRR